MRVQREKVEQEQIKRLLRSVGGQVYVVGTRRRRGDYQGTMQTPGIPDLLAFVPLREGDLAFVFIEVKASGGRLSPEQQRFRDYCRRASEEHITGGVNEVIAWLIARGIVQPSQFAHYRVARVARHAMADAGEGKHA